MGSTPQEVRYLSREVVIYQDLRPSCMAVLPLVVRYPNQMVVIYLDGVIPCTQTS